MHSRRFSHAEQFRDHVEPFLLQHEAENHLILGILTDIIAGKYDNVVPYLACVENDEGIVLVALRTPPYNLLLSATSDLTSIPILIADLQIVYTRLSGVSSVDDVSQAFVKQWHETTGQSYHLKMDQGIYQLQSINSMDYAKGSLRAIRDDDFELLVTWFQAFMSGIDSTVSEADAKSVLQNVLQHAPTQSQLFVWEVDGIPVTMAGYTGATPNGFRVSYVYTPIEYRRNGYATACTAAVSQLVLDMGRQYCFLYTDLDNPTSNHIYQDIGYQFVCAVKQYKFD